MFNVEKVSQSIADKVSIELNLDNDNREVIAYGAFAILHIFLSIVLVIIFGILFHVLVQALIISFTVSILRKYSGGAHSSTPGNCVTIGTIVCVGLGKVARLISSFVSLSILLILGIIVFATAYYLIFKLAPVDSPAKPLNNSLKKKRMKKSSIIILSSYLIIEVINISVYIISYKKNFEVYLVCIYLGIIWQIFTLTIPGKILVRKIDSLFTI